MPPTDDTNDPQGGNARKPNDADRYVGQQVRQARRELGLTQDALAAMLGITFQQIQKYESGQSRLSAGRLRDVAIALGKPVGFFYEPFELDGAPPADAGLRLQIQDLRRDGKRLLDKIRNSKDLDVAVRVLAALQRTA
ncbi:MAG: helix-turn-helix transcriptional regulator [Hyphomonas sp.]|nr:helix-turn-helix transcriptional regulator [Hyphomonas sp.]